MTKLDDMTSVELHSWKTRESAPEIARLTAELTEARARMTTDPKDDIRIEIMLRNEAQARAEKAEAKVAELERENQVLREGLQAHWGEHLDARLKYMLEQRRGSEQ